MSDWKTHRARVAIHTRHGNTEQADEARREMRYDRADEYIRALVDTFPPLTEQQRDRLALLLRPSAPADDK